MIDENRFYLMEMRQCYLHSHNTSLKNGRRRAERTFTRKSRVLRQADCAHMLLLRSAIRTVMPNEAGRKKTREKVRWRHARASHERVSGICTLYICEFSLSKKYKSIKVTNSKTHFHLINLLNAEPLAPN